MQFVLATTNPNKLKEVRDILSNFPIEIHSLEKYPVISLPEETGTTYEENASQKAILVAKRLDLPALGDDSGLEIDALNGRPGIYSNRFLGEKTPYEVKNKQILELLKNTSSQKRRGRFVCAAALAFPDGRVHVVKGEVRGIIAREIKGAGGFGYDPIFFLPEYGKTMAELSFEEKNKISHRAAAFQALSKYLKS